MKLNSIYIKLLGLVFMITSCGPVVRPMMGPNGGYGSQMPNEPGKCFAKVIMPDVYEVEMDSTLVYLGSEDISHLLVEEEIMTKRASAKWVKKKSDRNCHFADPNDCLVWCMVQVPAEYKTVKRLRDPSNEIPSQDLKWEVKEMKTMIQEGGNKEWVEVLCHNEITPSLFEKINTSLSLQGFVDLAGLKTYGAKTKASLTQYQKDNDLPVGQLDLVTLQKLGVN